MISRLNYGQNVAFKAAQVNILGTADNHGNLNTIPLLAETIRVNKEDIFIKAQEKSTLK